MAITLQEVTRDNWRDVVSLEPTPDQVAGDFVARNSSSLAEAAYVPGFEPRGIYTDDELIGFVMWFEHDEPDGLPWYSSDLRPEYWISRFMIDKEHQGKGYGRAAMELVIDEMARRYGCAEINLSYNVENEVAETLYTSLGFVPDGDTPWGETMARLKLEA